MFTEILDRLVRETPGARSATVMGFDGIAIESKDAPDANGLESAAAVEVAAVTSQLKRAAEGLGSGDVREVSLEMDGQITLLRPLTPEYCLALTLSTTGYAGKARYLMRLFAPQITAELI
jgi:predicted regulator of Ras-like GTPase activity (Roadblock/LC7/MglB family)